MNKIFIYISLLLISNSIFAQSPKHTYTIESKFNKFNLVRDGEKLYAGASDKATPFFIWFAELVHVDDLLGERHILQIEGNKMVIKKAPEMTAEQLNEYNDLRTSKKPVKEWLHLLPGLKSRWQFEPTGDGYVYIRCVYRPYANYLLTLTESVNDKVMKVGLMPEKHSLNDDQKWKLIKIN